MSGEIAPSVIQAFEIGLRLKRQMLEEGTETAQAECPRCGAQLHARLVGPKQHLRLACTDSRCISVME